MVGDEVMAVQTLPYEMAAHLVGARLQGDRRPALEILALVGLWRARQLLDCVEEARDIAEAVLKEVHGVTS